MTYIPHTQWFQFIPGDTGIIVFSSSTAITVITKSHMVLSYIFHNKGFLKNIYFVMISTSE